MKITKEQLRQIIREVVAAKAHHISGERRWPAWKPDGGEDYLAAVNQVKRSAKRELNKPKPDDSFIGDRPKVININPQMPYRVSGTRFGPTRVYYAIDVIYPGSVNKKQGDEEMKILYRELVKQRRPWMRPKIDFQNRRFLMPAPKEDPWFDAHPEAK